MKTIQVQQQNFIVNIIYKKSNKRIYLRVKGAIIEITTPYKLSDYTISDMISTNYNSIMKIMQQNQKIEDKIHFLGQEYTLVIKEDCCPLVYIQGNELIVELPKKNDLNVIKLTSLFYNEALENIVKKNIKEIQNKFHLSQEITFKFKNVKGYFGECFPKRNLVILASRLAKYDIVYIMSVIYHELAHFYHPNHQEGFYSYLENLFPNYRNVQKQMRAIHYNEKY